MVIARAKHPAEATGQVGASAPSITAPAYARPRPAATTASQSHGIRTARSYTRLRVAVLCGKHARRMQPPTATTFRSGFVALCGRPNVGKSTLLNSLLGQEIAVATRHPQTTRERMLGIWSDDAFQAVLVDTPGIHRARSALNRFMVDEAVEAAKGVDVVVYLAEVPVLKSLGQAEEWEPGEVAQEGLTAVAEAGHPVVLALNKIDRLRDRELLLPVIEAWRKLHPFDAVVPLSARTEEGLDELRRVVLGHLREGPAYYDPNAVSDRNLRWHVAELVRAELFQQLGQELPYSCAVTVEDFRDGEDSDRIDATVHVERPSQKGMVIGKGGACIRAISGGARQRIAGLTGKHCELFLQVKVTRNWTKDPDKLEWLGFRPQGSARGSE